MHSSHTLVTTTLWLTASALAQDAFLERRSELLASQPAGVELSVAAAKTEFYLGEVITLQLGFTSSSQTTNFLADTRLHDRIGRMNYVEEFVAAPAALVQDPLQGLQAGGGGLGGLSGGPIALSEKPFTFERVLNEWVRFTRPGEYRVYVISRRVSAIDKPGQTMELVSNILTLTIRPAPEGWMKQQIAAARATRDYRALRFLPGLDAASQLVLALSDGGDAESYANYMSVLGSPYRTELLPIMEQRLVAADQPVSEAYLNTLAQLRERTYPSGTQAQTDYIARLISALPGKHPSARVVSLHTLLNVGLRDDQSEPPWLPTVLRSLIRDFRSLPVFTQTMLLEHRWNALKGPEILPVLRDLVANPPPERFDPPIRSVALRRLYRLSPDEGRKIILAEIAKPDGSDIPFSTLAMLPDASLPEMDQALAGKFDALLILRYATGSVVKKIQQRVEERNAALRRQKLPFCTGPIAFYFLKHDPPYGERLLREQFEAEASPPGCYDIGQQVSQLGRWAYSPALEGVAIQSLTSPKVPVKRGAAEILGRFGSDAAHKPLWQAMEYFRSWWKGRESELKLSAENMQLEHTLRIALARADGWTLQAPELLKLSDLCSSDWCRTEVQGWITATKSPVSIEIHHDPTDAQAYTVAGYGPGDEQWLRRKLLQFPQSTTFQISKGPTSKEARDRVAELVGLTGRRLAGGAQ